MILGEDLGQRHRVGREVGRFGAHPVGCFPSDGVDVVGDSSLQGSELDRIVGEQADHRGDHGRDMMMEDERCGRHGVDSSDGCASPEDDGVVGTLGWTGSRQCIESRVVPHTTHGSQQLPAGLTADLARSRADQTSAQLAIEEHTVDTGPVPSGDSEGCFYTTEGVETSRDPGLEDPMVGEVIVSDRPLDATPDGVTT